MYVIEGFKSGSWIEMVTHCEQNNLNPLDIQIECPQHGLSDITAHCHCGKCHDEMIEAELEAEQIQESRLSY